MIHQQLSDYSMPASAITLAELFELPAKQPTAELLRFQNFHCTVDIKFWQLLNDKKLNEWKLSKPLFPIYGLHSSVSNAAQDKDKSYFRIPSEALNNRIQLDGELQNLAVPEVFKQDDSGNGGTKDAGEQPMVDTHQASSDRCIRLDGLLKNFNLLNEFKDCNRNHELLYILKASYATNQVSDKREDTVDGEEERIRSNFDSANRNGNAISLYDLLAFWKSSYLSTLNQSEIDKATELPISHCLRLLNRFLLLMYMDMKRYNMFYSIAFPAIVPANSHFTLANKAKTVQEALTDHSLDSNISVDCIFDELRSQIGLLQNKNSFINDGVFWVVQNVSPEQNSDQNTQGNISIDNGSSHSSSIKLYSIDDFFEILELFRDEHTPIVTNMKDSESKMRLLRDYTLLKKALDNITLCYLDPSTSKFAGWSLRNILYLLTWRYKLFGCSLKILGYRDAVRSKEGERQTVGYASMLYRVNLPEMFQFFGYERSIVGTKEEYVLQSNILSAFDSLHDDVFMKNWYATTVSGWLMYNPLPHTKTEKGSNWTSVYRVSLHEFLDKKALQKNAIDMNVRLIKWRMVPEFLPEKLQNLKFLLIGAGALGCLIGRSLVAWGVREITFVDNGRVSMSNPSRQWLYTHGDAFANDGLGMLKATAAKEHILQIRPDMECYGVYLDIPSPGHAGVIPASEFASVYSKLQWLIDLHDVVLLLTDSRESRWLPALMVAAKQYEAAHEEAAREEPAREEPARVETTEEGDATDDADKDEKKQIIKRPPFCMTVALGFDSLVVMRHSYMDRRLACYFCNDVTAPWDSISSKTLDQQCTVTRPGMATLACGFAVELISALTQHPEGFAAPHSSRDVYKNGNGQDEGSCLGATPHTLRVHLSDYKLMPLHTEPSVHCICCSTPVIAEFKKEGIEFVKKVIEDSSVLEEISGLDKMKSSARDFEVMVLSEDEYGNEDEKEDETMRDVPEDGSSIGE